VSARVHHSCVVGCVLAAGSGHLEPRKAVGERHGRSTDALAPASPLSGGDGRRLMPRLGAGKDLTGESVLLAQTKAAR
jgi:hypothetical protein